MAKRRIKWLGLEGNVSLEKSALRSEMKEHPF